MDKRDNGLGFDLPQNSINVLDVLSVVIHYKWILGVLSLLFFICVFGFAMYYWFKSPVYKESQMGITFKFKGADSFQYPNGTNFSEEDLLIPSNLQKIYNDMQLSNYFTSFNQFVASISMSRYNPRLAFLSYEFNNRLSGQNMSSAERYQLEQEFYRQTATIKKQPTYMLAFLYPNAESKNLSEALISKILYSVLDEWVNDAKTERGVTSYNLRLIKTTINPAMVEELDYFSAADYLRKKREQLVEEVKNLGSLPNANNVQIEYDAKQINIQDIESSLSNLSNYDITPLFYLIKSYGVVKDGYSTKIYIESQLSSLDIQLKKILREKQVIEGMMRQRVSDSSKELLVYEKNEIDIKNQISFYSEFLNSFSGSAELNKPVPTDISNKINLLLKNTINNENILINQVYDIYQSLNKLNLNRNSEFYSVDSFSTFNFRSIKLRNFLKSYLAIFVILEALMFIVIFLYEFMKIHKRKSGRDNVVNVSLPQPNTSQGRLRSLPEKSKSIESRKSISK